MLRRAPLLLAVLSWASVIIALYFSEGILRLIDPGRHLGPNRWVNGKLYTWGYLVENNRFGFREKDFSIPKPSSTTRIMVLGDSLTWGAGLDTRERYTNILNSLLNERFGEGKFEVLNFAVSGGPTVMERDLLKKYLALVEPNRIVVGFCINDPQPKGQDWSVEREAFEHRHHFFFDLLEGLRALGLHKLHTRLKVAAYTFAEKFDDVPSWEEALDRTYRKDSAEWMSFVAALREIKALSDSAGLPPPIFAVLNQALETGRASDFLKFKDHIILRWSHQAEAAAKEAGFIAYNHEKEIVSLPPDETLVINAVDSHPSARLNKIYAEKLFSVLSN
jgi:hypothetical protein